MHPIINVILWLMLLTGLLLLGYCLLLIGQMMVEDVRKWYWIWDDNRQRRRNANRHQ